MWTETYQEGLIVTVRRGGEQLLACLGKPQALELRDFLVEAFPLGDQAQDGTGAVVRSCTG